MRFSNEIDLAFKNPDKHTEYTQANQMKKNQILQLTIEIMQAENHFIMVVVHE
jgi:hypothetical protein